MIHNLYLIKHWPKEDQPNINPVIYCLEEEYNEEQALKDLKASEKPGYLAVLTEMDGFDTFTECLEAVNEDPLPKKLQTEEQTNKLMYKGKSYYFPNTIICHIPESNTFGLLFNLKKSGEPK